MPLSVLDVTLEAPGENLALEEALLEWCAAEDEAGALRFWESPAPFVVLGHSNVAAREVDLEACAELGVPVLRRSSGGGAVVQGPGCFNYALVLRMADDPGLASVPSTNRLVMERNRLALERALGRAVEVRGITDLAAEGRKFSGNAQKRGRTHLLFHGTILTGFDLGLVGRLLRMPSREPAYRAGRSHEEFVMNVGVGSKEIQEALIAAWGASGEMEVGLLMPVLERLMRERYGREEWHRKF